MIREVPLDWRPTPLWRSLSLLSLLGIVASVALARTELLVAVAPMLGYLAAASRTTMPLTASLAVAPTSGGDPSPVAALRGFEGDTFDVRCGTDLPSLRLIPLSQPGIDVDCIDGGVRITAQRWGRYTVRIRLAASAGDAIAEAHAVVPIADMAVFPYAAIVEPVPQRDLLNRFGAHRSVAVGSGVEFAGIRPYVPGDQLRQVNWPATSRRRQLQVNQRFTERAADLVIVLDAYPQASGPADWATERSIRGAAAVARGGTLRGDRVNVVVLGAHARWVRPEVGRLQYYRIVDALLSASPATKPASGTLVPREAAPKGAAVLAFSTLMDAQFGFALRELRHRGHDVLVCDVLTEPPFDSDDLLESKLWRLERSELYRDLSTIGINVVPWDPEAELGQVITAARLARQ